jgi:hypothetical protein
MPAPANDVYFAKYGDWLLRGRAYDRPAISQVQGALVTSTTAKQKAIEAIERLPDDVPLEEIVYRLFMLKKINEGMDDVDAGRVTSGESLAIEIEEW